MIHLSHAEHQADDGRDAASLIWLMLLLGAARFLLGHVQKSRTDRQTHRRDERHRVSVPRSRRWGGDGQRGGQAGSAESVYLPAGRQGGVVKGGGGGEGQEEVEPEQGHS